MKVHVNIGFTLTLVVTLTSFQSVLSGSPFFRTANQNAPSAFRRESPLLSRHTRNAREHFFCTSLGRLSDIKSQFEQWMDANRNGRASFPEVKKFLQRIKANISDDFVSSYIARRDRNGNGEIDLIPEYVQEMVGGDYGDRAANEYFFLQDINDDGFVSHPELVHLAKAMGMSQERAEDMARGYYLPLDTDGDDQLDYNEFRQLYQDPSL